VGWMGWMGCIVFGDCIVALYMHMILNSFRIMNLKG
jgi:hypothetical protein